MSVPFVRRVAVGALACLLVLAAVGPAAADSRVRKLEPRRTVPYRLGSLFTPNTDVLSVSGYAAWMIDELLEAYTPLPRLGGAFTRAEREEGINARFFLAHAILESGWGTSPIVRRKHNLFGYSAFDRDPWRYATRYRTYEQGIRDVAEKVRDGYLTPGGRWWYRFTTARAINRYYASDPRWADKVADLANVVDQLVVTLRERDLRFDTPSLAAPAIAGAALSVDVPWQAAAGAALPPAIRFAVRWTPVALFEASPGGPATPPATPWRLVRRADRPDGAVRLAVPAPATPGAWRLEIEARDSDGLPLPRTDRPPVRPLLVRVSAASEAGVSIGQAGDGTLTATVRNAGRTPLLPAEAGTVAAEAWALPLDPALPAYPMASMAIALPLEPGGARTVAIGEPVVPAVVVVRLVGDPAGLGRTLPVAALATREERGRLLLQPLAVASPRDDALLGREPAAERLRPGPSDAAGSLRVAVAGAAPLPEIGFELAAVEDPPGRPSLLVRTLAAEPGRPAAATDALALLPAAPSAPGMLEIAGIAPGVRLVMAAVVPADAGPAEAASVRLAWVVVGAAPPGAIEPT